MTDQEEKRRATLADRFLAHRWAEHERWHHPKAIEQLQRATRSAHRFVFDEEATRRTAKLIRDIPDLLVREHQFARAPFDIVWIEVAAWVLWDVLNRDETTGELRRLKPSHTEETADHTLGFLIDHNRVNVIVGGTREHPDTQPNVTSMQYRLHTEWGIEDQLEICRRAGLSRLGLDQFMFGSSYFQLDPEHRRLLRNYNAIEAVPLNPNHRNYDRLMADNGLRPQFDGAVGELRTIVALLLMLNRPTVTRFVNRPASRGWHRNKVMPYMSHSTVHVDLDAVRTIRKVGTPEGDAVPRRRHEVKGHYCHDRTAHDYMRIAGCVHAWVATDEEWTPVLPAPITDDINHWLCSSCGGKRWWKRSHERGDAAKGYVIRDAYDVTSHPG